MIRVVSLCVVIITVTAVVLFCLQPAHATVRVSDQVHAVLSRTYHPVKTILEPMQLKVTDFVPHGHREGSGLGKDFDVFLNMLAASELSPQANGAWVVSSPGVRVHIEHINELHDDVTNIFVPNQELITSRDVDKMRSKRLQFVLCKSKYAGDIMLRLREKIGAEWAVKVVSFPCMTKSLYQSTSQKWKDLLFHPAGKSWMKNTDPVVDAWKAHPEWPTLVVSGRKGAAHANIVFIDFLTNVELERLQHHAGAMLMPSACEGFGYSIREAMANGNLLMTTKIP